MQEGIPNAWPQDCAPKRFKTQLEAVMRYYLSREEAGEEISMYCVHAKRILYIKKEFP